MLNTNYTNYYVRYHIHSMQREEDTAIELIEVMILNMAPHQFSMFVKMAFVNSYRVDCNLVNCINNCNR